MGADMKKCLSSSPGRPICHKVRHASSVVEAWLAGAWHVVAGGQCRCRFHCTSALCMGGEWNGGAPQAPNEHHALQTTSAQVHGAGGQRAKQLSVYIYKVRPSRAAHFQHERVLSKP